MSRPSGLGQLDTRSRDRLSQDAAPTSSESAIRPLPPDVISQLRSSITITSLTGVVLELLRNSLDAGATKVDISIDWRRGGCTVEDDGWGIPPAEFHETGNLGKMHCRWQRDIHSNRSQLNSRVQVRRNTTFLCPPMDRGESFSHP
jgi:hypothetical protein